MADIVEAIEVTVLAELIGPGEVTPLFEVPLVPPLEGAEGVKIELTLKSEEGFGEVNTVVEVVAALVVDKVAEPFVRGDVGGGGVVGGVVGDPVGDPVGGDNRV